MDWEHSGAVLAVHGTGGRFTLPPDIETQPLYLENAGTAARFLTTMCTLITPPSAAAAASVVLTGNARMQERPIRDLVDALRGVGVDISYVKKEV